MCQISVYVECTEICSILAYLCEGQMQTMDFLLEKLLQMKIASTTVPGYEPDPRIKAEPIARGRAQHSPGRKKNRRKPRRSYSSKTGGRRSFAQ